MAMAKKSSEASRRRRLALEWEARHSGEGDGSGGGGLSSPDDRAEEGEEEEEEEGGGTGTTRSPGIGRGRRVAEEEEAGVAVEEGRGDGNGGDRSTPPDGRRGRRPRRSGRTGPAGDGGGGEDEGSDDDGGGGDDDAASPAPAHPPASISYPELLASVDASCAPPSSRRPLADLLFPPRVGGGSDDLGASTFAERRDAIRAPLLSPSFSKARARRLFGSLLPAVRRVAEEGNFLPPDDDDDEGGEGDEEGSESGGRDEEEAAIADVRSLRCAALLVAGYLDGLLARRAAGRNRTSKKPPEAADEAFDVAEALHSQLFPLQSAAGGFDDPGDAGTGGGGGSSGPSAASKREASAAQSSIFEVCETWWRADLAGKEQLVTQLIPLLLVRSLDPAARKGDVKRLCSMRRAIDLLDFEDESIRPLKDHLLRTAGNPLFLRSAEGRKFVAHLFGVDAGLGKELHLAARAQIPGAKKSILVAYADVYFAAWRGSAEETEDGEGGGEGEDVEDEDDGDAGGAAREGGVRSSLEEHALQDLAHQVLHASVPSAAKAARTVLDKFYVHKKSPDVESFLHRTYGPLLWRALSSADARIRRRAAEALADTFPLRDPRDGHEGTRACAAKSVRALEALLRDEVPSVRAEGSKATARILGSFWNAVPGEDVRTLLNREFVRLAKVEGEGRRAMRRATLRAAETVARRRWMRCRRPGGCDGRRASLEGDGCVDAIVGRAWLLPLENSNAQGSQAQARGMHAWPDMVVCTFCLLRWLRFRGGVIRCSSLLCERCNFRLTLRSILALNLADIVARHASDASSSAVRAAAVDAVTALLGEDRTHAVLRPLLPSLGNLVHDRAPKVRLAVVKLLLVVKKVRGMKYYHVVPANHLLARLADEGRGGNDPRGPVARGLSDLLGNSFVPVGKGRTSDDVVRRTMRLLRDSPGAAATFYRNASSMLSRGSVARLVAALMRCLCHLVAEEKRQDEEDLSGTSLSLVVEGDESVERSRDGRRTDDTALMATIAESISILWDSVSVSMIRCILQSCRHGDRGGRGDDFLCKNLRPSEQAIEGDVILDREWPSKGLAPVESEPKDAQNETVEEILAEVFEGNILTEVLCHFESRLEQPVGNVEADKMADCHRACVAILNCAGKMDEAKIEGLRSHILQQLTRSSDMQTERRWGAHLAPGMALLCAWGMTEEVVQCLAASVSGHFVDDSDGQDVGYVRKSDASRKRRSRGTGRKQDRTDGVLPNLDVEVSLEIIGHILQGSYPASESARQSILESETAFEALASALSLAKGAAERLLKPQTVDRDVMTSFAMIRSVGISLECHGRLLIHKEVTKGQIPINLPSELKASIIWVTGTIVQYLTKLVDRQDASLRDLDLSSIMGSPMPSPDSGAAPRRKSNRISSPNVTNIGDASFISERGSNVFEDRAGFCQARTTAVVAMNSVLSTLVEWLSLRCTRDRFAADQVGKLFKLIECLDVAVRKALLPLLIHIAISSLKNQGDPTLLGDILLGQKIVDPSEIEIVSHSVATAMSLRDEELGLAAASAIVHACKVTVDRAEAEEGGVSLLDIVGECMRNVVNQAVRKKQSSLLLAQCLANEPKSSLVREALFAEIESNSPKSEALKYILCKTRRLGWVADDSTKHNATSPEDEENNDVNKVCIEPILA
ncbi:hypothetical protein ACHAWF_011800 [Thalassiosira exigua]